MKNNILLVLLFFLIPVIINGQTQEATTLDGKRVILNADGTWEYAEEITTSDGKKVILNADGTWKYTEEVNQGLSYDLQGRKSRSIPIPKYDYLGEGRVVVEVSVNRSGKVLQAIPGSKGSTTLDEYLLKVAKDAALKATFDPKADASEIQKGTITYNFSLR